jgi:hypothetical protein
LTQLLATIERLVAHHTDEAAFPMAVLVVVGSFLSVQNRIDRSDPKLALAPVYAESDLPFPPPGRRS